MNELRESSRTGVIMNIHREGTSYRASLPLRFFYGTKLGRVLFRPILCRPISALAGHFLDTRLSRPLVRPFIRRNGIDMSQFEEKKYRSYNDFFTRRVKPGARLFSADPADFCAPCDSTLSVYPIDGDSVFRVKMSEYSVASLLDDAETATAYRGGICLIFRLGVQDYHRYAFPDAGTLGDAHRIKGIFHTVQPVAVESVPVFHRNTREWVTLETENFGSLLYVEIGALMVGRICNHPGLVRVERGQEKGYFAFGGSTVILLVKPGVLSVDGELWENTERGLETPVRQGEVIGHRAEKA